MTKEAAIQNFFEGFGISAYKSTRVPEDVTFPWLTYELITGSYENNPVSITVNLWYYTENESLVNAKVREIEAAIDYGGKPILFDDGFMMLYRGDPWCQSLSDDTDRNISRRYMNMTIQYYSMT